MSKIPFGEIIEIIEVLALTLGTGLLSSVGVYLENLGVTAISGGNVKIGAWFLGMGLIALYAGIYLLGYETLVLRVFGRADPDGDVA
ncbi:hypothetical protein ACERIT_04855 [Halopenitus sp. H-Gu1]|uniref:hypothetical protein n=1 Tax=Halopenitus sp. H-Gu1 TaxID=3242697 RepID=UPI00359DFD7A